MSQGNWQKHGETQFLIIVGSRYGCRDGWRPLPTSTMKRFLSLVAGFGFTSREYASQRLPMTAPEP